MVVKNRTKGVRKLGHHDHCGLRRRGSGNRGGVGAAGHGKRCKQKKHSFIVDGKVDYGKHGFASKMKRVESISVGLLNEQAVKLGTKKGNKYYIDLGKKKILGSGSVNLPLVLSNFSKITEKAKDKILNAGGEVIST